MTVPIPAEMDSGGSNALRRICLLVGAALLALLVIRSPLEDELPPRIAVKLVPLSAASLYRVGVERFAASGRIDARDMDLFHLGLKHAPLSPEPFAYGALHEEGEGNPLKARILAQEALRRDPRLVLARAWLMWDHLRDGRLEEALREAGPLYATAPELRGELARTLAALATLPEAREAIRAAAPSRPAWLWGLITELKNSRSDPALVVELARSELKRLPTAEGRREQQSLLKWLVAHGHIGLAREAWESFLPLGAVAEQGVFDPNFQGSRAPAPFNWELHESPAGRAQFTNDGLRVDYLPGQGGPLISQLLTLKPGEYRLLVGARQEAGAAPSTLALKLSCLTSNRPLLDRSLDGLGKALAQIKVDFSVPAGCPGQRLELAGEEGDGGDAQIIVVKSMQVSGR